MKILELGTNTKENWKLETICTGKGNNQKGCESKLLVEYADLRYFAEQEFPWRIQPEAVCFRCPVCGTVTDLDKEQWPNDRRSIREWERSWHDGNAT
jgi:hypothetical protein